MYLNMVISRKAQKINFVDWIGFLENLASAKNCDVKDIKNKLVECEGPHSIGTTVRYQPTCKLCSLVLF